MVAITHTVIDDLDPLGGYRTSNGRLIWRVLNFAPQTVQEKNVYEPRFDNNRRNQALNSD
jgi:hypothetical protein